ncbi:MULTISPECIES: TraR/DksA family transcriptional regulator [Martelella]|uniref:Regulatory protein, yteA family n=1 Tax=Martelella mediterranea DSM 17316 TaxID=1122214 RepID=A0A1U9YYE3_9HYPH|nr:TraR/DksA C4-type zinc finger protein [Martelella mediterranea]AQZ50461.1 regulatory protein, yteA family [Martelella mediterranea DSM 17316]
MDVAHYKAVLETRQAEILKRLHRIDDDLGRTRDPDSAERATEAENDEVLEEFGHVGSDELKALEAALQRIEAGTYGKCVKCGKPISEERLDVVPQTPFCKKCAASL